MYALILPRMAQLHTDLVAALDDFELAQFDAMLARLHQQAQALEHDTLCLLASRGAQQRPAVSLYP